MPDFSIVVPIYNESPDTLRELIRRVEATLTSNNLSYEIIFVDDGSKTDIWNVIKSMAAASSTIKGIKLARNFGQHVAITAGLDQANGNWVVVMDSDLEDRPEIIPDLYAKAREGYDVVFVNRLERPMSRIYGLTTRCFYYVLNALSGQEYNALQSNFSIVSSKAVSAFRRMRERTRFYGGILRWVGFKQTSISAIHGARHAGESGYTFMKRVRFALTLILGFSSRLLYFSIAIGAFMAMASLLIAAYIVIEKLRYPEVTLLGWSSVITAILFTGGVTNLAIGFVGLYIGEIFQEIKGRPLYVTDEMTMSVDAT